METFLRVKQEHLQDDFSKYGFSKIKWLEGDVWEKKTHKTDKIIVSLLIHTKSGKLEIELDNTNAQPKNQFTKYLWTDVERVYSRELYEDIVSEVSDFYELLIGIELPGILFDLIQDGIIYKDGDLL